MKYFKHEIEKLFDRLKSSQKFSFSKYADGEWIAIRGKNVNNGEFKSDSDTRHATEHLKRSFTFRDDGYYVGISCPCCQGSVHYKMKEQSGQDENHLTFANLFVNGNYTFFKNNLVPEFSKYKIHLVANERSKVENLPFRVEKFYPIGFNAWVTNYSLVEEIISQDYDNKLFLFCAGPFGNILAHRLWDANKKNTYIDIGSTLNPWLGSAGFQRGYLNPKNSNRNKICTWA